MLIKSASELMNFSKGEEDQIEQVCVCVCAHARACVRVCLVRLYLVNTSLHFLYSK